MDSNLSIELLIISNEVKIISCQSIQVGQEPPGNDDTPSDDMSTLKNLKENEVISIRSIKDSYIH